MRYFVIARRFDGADSFSIMYDRPNLATKEERNATAVIALSAKADQLGLVELVELYKLGELQTSKHWRILEAPRAVEAGAKAFARYRETRAQYGPIHPAPTERDRKKERRRIIKKAQARALAIAALTRFCVEFGAYRDSYKLED